MRFVLSSFTIRTKRIIGFKSNKKIDLFLQLKNRLFDDIL